MFFIESPAAMAIMILSIVISLAAQISVKSAYSKYSKVITTRGLTGAAVAQMIVQGTGVSVVLHHGGQMSDHFDPRQNMIALSPEVYSGNSVAALGIAAHEAGHALQYDKGYFPIKLRNGLLPLAQIGTSISWPLIMIGLFFSSISFLINLGIIFFIAALLFQIFTLPVEFNASRRAIAILSGNAYLTAGELKGAKTVLSAAAMTYVAAVITSLLQLLRLLMLANRRR